MATRFPPDEYDWPTPIPANACLWCASGDHDTDDCPRNRGSVMSLDTNHVTVHYETFTRDNNRQCTFTPATVEGDEFYLEGRWVIVLAEGTMTRIPESRVIRIDLTRTAVSA